MKISGVVIQNRNISVNTNTDFEATYKGKQITISSNHGFGKPVFNHLTRFDVVVIDIKSGMYDVQSYEDCHTIQDAIRYALKGACLI